MEWSWKFIFICGFILLSLKITHQAANMALGGVANQSSLWEPTLRPSFAIDGKSHSTYESWSCTSTQWEDNPWWRLDMRAVYDISSIEVIRRSDSAIKEIDGAEIRIGNSLENNGNNNPRCAVITVVKDVTMIFSCSQMQGRYINIFLPGVAKRLHLCEVKVYTTTHITGANVALGGEAFNSSSWDPLLKPNVVIDGKPYTNYLHGSCMSSRWTANPWWRLDMRGPYTISTIEVIRRSDWDIYSLNKAEIRIGNSLENNGNNNPRCAVITVTNDVTMAFNCSKMEGRYVNIFLPGSNVHLDVCEVKVYATTHITGANLAPEGLATQSAEPVSEATAPQMAIDVNSGQNPHETCASVPQQDNPWWQLDLNSICRITAVSIISKGECCQEELDRAEIRIGFNNDTSNQRCAVISTAKGQRIYDYQCGIMEGRYVHVVLPGLQKKLTICEVRVYGTVLENVALRGVVFQSSWRHDTTSHPSSVIDGQLSTCTLTEDGPGQWVKVDLLVPYNVTLIQLIYMEDLEDCCHSHEIWVNQTRCWVIANSSLSQETLNCGGVVGRYVTIIYPDTPMALCEVKVYSNLENPENKLFQCPPPHDFCSLPSCSSDYILIHNEPKTWFEAQTYCRERYTDLATISNIQDMSRVIDQMETDFNDFWIGLFEDFLTWKWSLSEEGYYGDGEAEFRNWGVGEHNTKSGVQHCAAIQHTGEWKELDCALLNFFLCFDGREGAPVKTLVETPMTWTDAQHYCRGHHADLLSIRNQAENQEIQSMVPAGKLTWIGLFRDSWKWSDGSNSTFRYWSQGPLESLGEGPNCAHIYDRKWSAKSCDTKSMFLCYYFKKRSVVKISTDFDMSDPVIQQQILSQLDAEMKNKGISDFKIRWRMSGQVAHKEEKPQPVPPLICETLKV